MSPVEMREHPATAGNPASREIRILLVDAAMVVAAAMPVVEVVVGIEAAGKRADEEFQWRIK